MMNKHRTYSCSALVAMLGGAAIVLSACGGNSESKPIVQPTPVAAAPSDAAAVAAPTAAAQVAALASPLASPLESPLAGELKVGVAGIDRVTLRVDAAAPQTVAAKVKGYLGDACTQLGAVTQVRDGNVIRVSVGTLRPANRMCAQVVKDFEIDVAIDATGLAVGTYNVDVNGTIAAFDVDEKGAVVK